MERQSASPAHSSPTAPESGGDGPREMDALYQGGRIVARVIEPEVDREAKEIRFAEAYHSDELMIPEECEFQEYRILIQKIAYATKIQRGEEHKGRVLRGVTADILGFRTP